MKGLHTKIPTKVFIAFLISVLILSLACGCSGSGDDGVSNDKDTLIIGLSELPPTIDIETAQCPIVHQFTQAFWGQLLRFKMKPATTPGVEIIDYETLEGALADSWEISQDSNTITFHLRDGVESPWGNEFNAEDVYWKWERGLELQGICGWWTHVMDVAGIDSFEIVDSSTIKVTAEQPNFFLGLMHATNANGFPDSVEALKHATKDDPWAQEYLSKYYPSYGPYYVTGWLSGNQVVMEANPNYWEGQPEISKLIWKVIPESSSRVAMIKDGTIDVALELSPTEINSWRDAPGVKTVEEDGVKQIYMVFNGDVFEPFKNQKVRQAINYAIDRDKIVDMAFYGMAKPMTAPVPVQFPTALDPKEFPYDHNIDKAKQLMSEAGYADGFEVELYYQSNLLPYETTCLIIKEELAKIGIDVTLRKTPIATFQTMLFDQSLPLALWSNAPICSDVNYCCTLTYGTGAVANFGGFSSTTIDKMIEDGKTIMDPVKRKEFHFGLQKQILEEAPVGFIVDEGYKVALRDNIQGWNIDIMEACNWDRVYFE